MSEPLMPASLPHSIGGSFSPPSVPGLVLLLLPRPGLVPAVRLPCLVEVEEEVVVLSERHPQHEDEEQHHQDGGLHQDAAQLAVALLEKGGRKAVIDRQRRTQKPGRLET